MRIVTESLSLRSLCVSVFGFYIVSGSVLHAILLIAALSSQIKLVPEGWGFLAAKEESLETVRNTSYFRGVIFFCFSFSFCRKNCWLLAAGFLEGKRTSVSVVAAAAVVSRGEEQDQKKLVVRKWRLLLFVSFFLFFPCLSLLFSVSLARVLCVSSFILVGSLGKGRLVPLPLYCYRRSWICAQVFFSLRLVGSGLWTSVSLLFFSREFVVVLLHFLALFFRNVVPIAKLLNQELANSWKRRHPWSGEQTLWRGNFAFLCIKKKIVNSKEKQTDENTLSLHLLSEFWKPTRNLPCVEQAWTLCREEALCTTPISLWMSLQKIEERMSVLVAAMEALLPQMSSVEEQRLQGYCHSPSHHHQRLEQVPSLLLFSTSCVAAIFCLHRDSSMLQRNYHKMHAHESCNGHRLGHAASGKLSSQSVVVVSLGISECLLCLSPSYVIFLVGCYSWLHIPKGKGIVLWSLKSRNLWIQFHVLVVMMLLMAVVFFRNTAAVWSLTQQMRMLLFQKISIRSSVGYP